MAYLLYDVGLYPGPACWQPDQQPGWSAPCWACEATVLATDASDRCQYCGWVVCDGCGACAEPEKVFQKVVDDTSASGVRMCVCPCGVLAGGRWGVSHHKQLETIREDLRRFVPIGVGDRVEWRRGSQAAMAVVVREEGTDLVVRMDDGRESLKIARASGRVVALVDFEPLYQGARAKGLCEVHRNKLLPRR